MEEINFSFIINHTPSGYALIATAKDADGVNIVQPLVEDGLTPEEAFAKQLQFYNTNKPN